MPIEFGLVHHLALNRVWPLSVTCINAVASLLRQRKR